MWPLQPWPRGWKCHCHCVAKALDAEEPRHKSQLILTVTRTARLCGAMATHWSKPEPRAGTECSARWTVIFTLTSGWALKTSVLCPLPCPYSLGCVPCLVSVPGLCLLPCPQSLGFVPCLVPSPRLHGAAGHVTAGSMGLQPCVICLELTRGSVPLSFVSPESSETLCPSATA